MHPRADSFAEETRRRYEFDPEIHEFPEGTKTAAEAADAVGCDLGQIASSIVVSTADGLAVVVTSGAHRVDMDRVADHLDTTDVDMADPSDVKETLGWGIGGVPPFCHETDVPVLIDETLFDYDQVWAAGGTPDTVFPIDPEMVAEFSGGRPGRIHE